MVCVPTYTQVRGDDLADFLTGHSDIHATKIIARHLLTRLAIFSS